MNTITPGDKVLRKADKTKRVAVGIVHRINGRYADVDWPAPTRIGGDGWHRSRISLTAIEAATDAEIASRRAAIQASIAERKRLDLVARPWLCHGTCRRILRDVDLTDGACRYCGGPVERREV